MIPEIEIVKRVKCPLRERSVIGRDSPYVFAEECETCFAKKSIDEDEVVCAPFDTPIIFERGSTDWEKDLPPYRI